MVYTLFLIFFFFKQKTAYEMRISDWSSDVCSSDLERRRERQGDKPGEKFQHCFLSLYPILRWRQVWRGRMSHIATIGIGRFAKIGRASCRERVCQYV